MQSYRKRIAVQAQPIKTDINQEQRRPTYKKSYADIRAYLLKAINLYEIVSKKFDPLSDDWKTCLEDLQKYKFDFELLERGTYEERKGVIEKYGR